jgi:hypothetical protein
MKKLTCIASVLLSLGAGVANAADTQGKVSKVVTLPVMNGKHVVRIYFSTYTSDRFGCLQNLGYIEANDASPYLDAKGLDRLVGLAATAIASDMTLGLDSPGVNPCTEANMFHLIKG